MVSDVISSVLGKVVTVEHVLPPFDDTLLPTTSFTAFTTLLLSVVSRSVKSPNFLLVASDALSIAVFITPLVTRFTLPVVGVSSKPIGAIG